MTLTPSEEQLMLIIWQDDATYMREIMDRYPDPKPHQNTVSTFLKILIEKGFVSAEKEGRIAKYSTKISKENYRLFLLKKLVDDYFSGSAENLQDLLINKKMIDEKKSKTDDEKSQISDYLDELIDGKKHKKKKKDKKKK